MRPLRNFIRAFHRHIPPGIHFATNIIHGFRFHPARNQQSHLSLNGSIAVGRVHSNFITLLNTVHHQLPHHSTVPNHIIVSFDPPAQNHSPILCHRQYNPLPRATILAPRQAYHSPFNYDLVSNHSDRYNISCAFHMNWLLWSQAYHLLPLILQDCYHFGWSYQKFHLIHRQTVATPVKAKLFELHCTLRVIKISAGPPILLTRIPVTHSFIEWRGRDL